MKIRLYGNSVRVRLSRTEVDQLADGKIVEDRTELSPVSLRYQLAPVDHEDGDIRALFANGCLSVTVPIQSARQLRDGDESGIESADGSDGAVRILIERDFRCLHGDGEDQADCFDNPLARETS